MAFTFVRSVGSMAMISRSKGGQCIAALGRNRYMPTRWLSTTPRTWVQSSATGQADTKNVEKANYKARVELALTYRAVEYYQLGEGICNHLTMRAPGMNTEGDVMLVVPYGLHWSQVTASSLIGVDFLSGEKVEGGEGNALETAVNIHCPIHLAKYKMDGTTTVMHTHQPYILALVCLDEAEPFDVTMCQTSMRFAGKIAYDWDYQTVASEMEEGQRLAAALGDKQILLMGQHGVLTTGRRACDALDTLYYLERAAQVQVLARSMGAKTRSASPEVVRGVSSHPCIPRNAEKHMEALHKLMVDKKPYYME